MFGLGIGWLTGHFKLKLTQAACIFSTFFLQTAHCFFLIQHTFSKAPPSLIECIFLHTLLFGFFSCSTFNIHSQLFILEVVYFSFLIKVYGMVQYFDFLSFLPPLERFGLATPKPVGISVLGV